MRRRLRALLVLVFGAPLALAALLAAILAWGWRIEEPAGFDAATAARVTLSPPRELAPAGLPAEPAPGLSNNNLDVARFGGLYFLGIRSAPHHFASDAARVHVYASRDRERWTHEATFDLEGRDLREPRFLALGERLIFTFFEAEDDPLGFEPVWTRASVRGADGRWGEAERIFEPGHVFWRMRPRTGGGALACVYDGRALYARMGEAGGVRLLASDDGLAWRSLSGAASPVPDPGASECDFELDAAGGLVALVRVEARGALLCTAPPHRLERWDCAATPFRHDSPLLFEHGDEIFAIARRNLGGPLLRAPGTPSAARQLWWLVRYSATRKRTALYRVLPGERRTLPVLDLPSRGDTAFAGIAPLDGGGLWIANYSSPLDGPDWPWFLGQLTGSRIYAQALQIAPPGPAATPPAAARP